MVVGGDSKVCSISSTSLSFVLNGTIASSQVFVTIILHCVNAHILKNDRCHIYVYECVHLYVSIFAFKCAI